MIRRSFAKQAILAITMAFAVASCGQGIEDDLAGRPQRSNKRSAVTEQTSADAKAAIPPAADGIIIGNIPDTVPISNATPLPGTTTPDTQGSATPDDSGTIVIQPTVVDTPRSSELTLVNACYKGEQFLCLIEIAIAKRTNEYRASQNNLNPLQYSSAMAWVARDWSMGQARQGSIGHQGFPADRYTTFTTEFGPAAPVSFAAENVAYAYGTSTLPDEIAATFMTMWINSAGHRANILGNFVTLGVGVAKTGNYYYATQLFGK